MAIVDILDELEAAEAVAALAPVRESPLGEEVLGAPSSAATGGSHLTGNSQSLVSQLLKQPLESLEDIARLFRAAKGPADLYAYAQDCSTPVWLDWMIKLSPKQVKMQGSVDVRAAFVNLGPAKPIR